MQTWPSLKLISDEVGGCGQKCEWNFSVITKRSLDGDNDYSFHTSNELCLAGFFPATLQVTPCCHEPLLSSAETEYQKVIWNRKQKYFDIFTVQPRINVKDMWEKYRVGSQFCLWKFPTLIGSDNCSCYDRIDNIGNIRVLRERRVCVSRSEISEA